jgi:uncharacterized protein YbjT (DUF2867 family)
MNTKTVLLLGATGLVGELTLRYLLANQKFSKVVVLTRRPLESGLAHPKLESHIVDFKTLCDGAHKRLVKADVVISCLGTTMAKAKTKEHYREIDYDIPVMVARLALENGAKQYLLVSSMGASATSKFFYTRLKGETEEAIAHYAYESVSILRPSFLYGNRKEFRPLEKWTAALLGLVERFFFGRLKSFQGIQAATVARALVNLAWTGERGIKKYESETIKIIAEQRHWV